MLYHFTQPRYAYNNITLDSSVFTGFGEPDIKAALFASENSGSYIYEGEISTNKYQYIKFYVPTMLAEDNPDTKLKIKTTLVYDPPINPDNDLEYSCSRISMSLIKATASGDRVVNTSCDEKYNLPWNPIIKCEKTFSRSYSTGEWYIKLRLYTRGMVKNSYIQKFAVIIEVIDEKGNLNVYNSINSEFNEIYQKIAFKVAA